MNSSRMNRLEELGRVDSEKADTSKGKKNLSEEKSRIVRELKADGGKVKKRKKAGRLSQQRQMGRGAKSSNEPIIIDLDLSKPKADRKIKIKKFKMSPEIKTFANGGMVTVSGRGQGKVMPGRNKKTYIC